MGKEQILEVNVASELLRMADADQEMRQNVINGDAEWDEQLDVKNAARLKEIVNTIGWPTISKVGKEASQAAWLLVQHAAEEPDFMTQCLVLMKESGEGEVSPQNIAFLEDRILAFSGRPQIYGTQFRTTENGLVPFPIADIERLEERRSRMGLEPYEDNCRRMHRTYGSYIARSTFHNVP